MVKKKDIGEEFLNTGVGLSIGSTVIGRIPSSQSKTGVQEGFGVSGRFFSPLINISVGGQIVSGLKKLGRKLS